MAVDQRARTWVKRRDGAHQIVDRNGALGPVDDAVFGFAAAEVRTFAWILRNRGAVPPAAKAARDPASFRPRP
jgi:hypothetical protein